MPIPMRTFSPNKDLVALRREHIAKCAAHILAKKGYDQTSVREIAEVCNMGVGNLYHYIGGKEDILYLVVDTSISKLLELLAEVFARLNELSPTVALKRAIDVFYRQIDIHQDLILFVYQETKNVRLSSRQSILDLENRVVDSFEQLLTRGCEVGEFKISDVSYIAHNVVILGHMWAVRRWFLKKHLGLEKYIENSTQFILKAICP